MITNAQLARRLRRTSLMAWLLGADKDRMLAADRIESLDFALVQSRVVNRRLIADLKDAVARIRELERSKK